MKKDQKDHVHCYFKASFKTSKTIIYRCSKPNCSHFIYEPFIVGRFCECYRCHITFLVTKRTIKAKRLHCEDCTREKYNKVKPNKEVVQLPDIEQTALDNILWEVNNPFLSKEDKEGQENKDES